MIPQAIANTGPYAGLWSDLKSMRHALERAIRSTDSQGLTELDRSRLQALIHFLKCELDPQPLTQENLLSSVTSASQYSLDIDLRQFVKTLDKFENWQRASKLGFKEKANRLIHALEDFLATKEGRLFPAPPKEELLILDKILAELLVRTEMSLLS